MKENIIGRDKEKQILSDIYNSGKSEFVAVCGRRRVGKTFLIKEYFEEELLFQTSGVANANKTTQIKTFYNEMLSCGLQSNKKPADWIDVFFMLRQIIEQSKQQRKVILLDELPWMDTPRSGFISALEHFWNSWASSRHDVVLVVCGSSTSWMMNKLIQNHGGLYNRITQRIFLEPFTLKETEQMLQHKGFMLSRYEIAELYMILGGIPFYIDMLQQGLSLSQNIDDLLFRRNGSLRNEFDNLYASLFTNSDDYVKVVSALSKRKIGLTRAEIVDETKLNSGGGLSAMLQNLEWSGFLRIYDNYMGKRGETTLYQLTDFFTLFYFHFLRKDTKAENTWTTIQHTPEFHSWIGLTFELLALLHINQVKSALGISGVRTKEYAWRQHDEGQGAQIDLVIDRTDNTVNLCEMKFSINPYEIDKDYEMNLRNKLSCFIKQPKFRKSVQLTFITTYGVVRNTHCGIVNNEITLEDLFT